MSALGLFRIFRAVVGALGLLACAQASADLVDLVNDIRWAGCGATPAAGAPLRRDPALDDAARSWARGSSLEAALERNGYPAAKTTSIQIDGTADDDAIRRFLSERYCAAVNDGALATAGEFRRGRRSWLVLAAPLSTAALEDAESVRRRVLDLVNAARAERRRCGREPFAPAPPLELSEALNSAAAAHARDMAARGSIGHTGSDGSEAAERVTRAGYAWRAVGENVAAGQTSPETVVAEWLDSPSHCTNIMASQFTEMGVAFALGTRSRAGVYWTQVFAAPR